MKIMLSAIDFIEIASTMAAMVLQTLVSKLWSEIPDQAEVNRGN